MKLPMFEEPSEEELAAMRRDAPAATGCMDWLNHCGAECCTGFSIDDRGQDLSHQKVRIFGNATADMIRYYELHNCTYRMPHLYIPTRNAHKKNGRIFFMERCKALTPEGKCSLHGTLAKPKVCRELNMENIAKGEYYGGAKVTPSCLFRFKMEANHGNT